MFPQGTEKWQRKSCVSIKINLLNPMHADLGHTNTIKMKIDTGDQSPIKMKPYHKRIIVDKAIDEMLSTNIIRSISPLSFPIVVVDKKNGTKRFCVEFRQLNKITKTNSWPLYLNDDNLD